MVGHVFEISWLELIINFYVGAFFSTPIVHKVNVLQEKKFSKSEFLYALKIIWISLFKSLELKLISK